ncbi:MAG: metal-dependent transcriptional regulator [Cyclobacteriaceae bacterium]
MILIMDNISFIVITELTTPASPPNPVIALGIFIGVVIFTFLVLKLKVIGTIFKTREQRDRELIEDILKQLYHVQKSNTSANVSSLAGALRIGNARLISIVEHMSEMELINTDGDRLVLTETGQDYALKIIRIHRIWEKYLSEKTGYNKLDWHGQAEEKEHKLTAKQTEEIYQELGNPRYDPHGDPIPTEQGEMLDANWSPLPSFNANDEVRIVHIEDEPEVVFKQIIGQKLHIGSHLKLTSTEGQSIKFYCEGINYELSTIIGSNINAVLLNNNEIFERGKVRLSSLEDAKDAQVLGISSECRGAARRRLLDLGFTPGANIKAEYAGPNKNPRAYRIRNTLIALRNDQAELILIEKK